MKRCSWFILILVLFLTPQLWADDTDIYGTSTISMPPNVLIIFDTSGSMTTQDVPGDYYDPSTTYSGSRTSTAVYQKVCGWGCSYNSFASSINDLSCPDVKTALETDGYKTDASIMDSAGGYVCGGSGKDLYLGNWINYDENYSSGLKTRTEVAKEVITQVINDTNDVRFGLMRFNNNGTNAQGGYVVAECGTDKTTLINAVNSLPADGYTPLAETLAEAGLYLAGKTSWYNGSSGSYDSSCDTSGSGCKQYTSPMTERCQKNYIILMTDGASTQDKDSKLTSGTYINGDTIGDYDNDGNDTGVAPAPVYSDNGSDYLDDVAKYLYENDINPSLGPAGDTFEKQNVIIYTIGFRTDNQLLAETAYNGGGLYYTANSISGLTAAFQKIMTDISDVNAVFVSPVVPMSQMNRTFAGSSLYVGFFKPQVDGHWAGNIKKYGLDNQGVIVDVLGNPATLADGKIKDNAKSYWSTLEDGPNVLEGGIGEKLLDQATRNLYTYMGSFADLTNSTNAFSTSNTDITATTLGVGTVAEKDSVIDDIYGVGKTWKMGDILHSKPSVVHYDTDNNGTLDKTFIFSGTNDGMMHCFDDFDGSEVWGFIPPDQLTRLKELSDGTTDHKYFVDGDPTVYDDAGQKILMFGERRGGYNYYALNVTTYYSPSYLYSIGPTFLVNEDGNGDTTADGADATLGQSWSKPTVHKIKTSSGSDKVFLMAGGYDQNQDLATPAATDTQGRAVFTIKVADGTISTFNVNAGYYADMTHCIVDAAGYDTNGNLYTNRIYAGDLAGNIFAFEDDDGDGDWSHRKLFSASAVDGVKRKIFYAPDAVAERYGAMTGEMIFFGTGDRADPEETGVVNRIYAVKNEWTGAGFTTLTENELLDVTDDQIVLGDATQRSQAALDLANKKGWYIRLENPGEKMTSKVTVFDGVVYFTTYTPESGGPPPADPCVDVSGRGDARLYAVNYLTGAAAYEWSDIYEEDGDNNEVAKGKYDRNMIIGTSMASAPVIAILPNGPQLLVGVEAGILNQGLTSTRTMNTFYWRQMDN